MYHFIYSRTFLFVLIMAIVAKLLLIDYGFFGDNIPVLSTPAHYLYDNGLFNFIYPLEINNGDPQLVQFSIALLWTLFGKTLWVVHLLCLIFLIFLIFQLYKLSAKLIDKEYVPFVFILLLADPTLMAQALLITPDLFVMVFAIWAINLILSDHRKLLGLPFLLLCMSSRRGILICFGLMLFCLLKELIENRTNVFTFVKKYFFAFLPAAIFVLLFIIWRMVTVGWFFANNSENASWAGLGEIVGLKDFFVNCIILGRWFLDFGRIFLWIPMIYIIAKYRTQIKGSDKLKSLIILFSCVFVVMCCVTLTISNPFGPRYFILHYTIFALILSILIIKNIDKRFIKPIFLILIALLLSGNLWIYPEKIAQGWDSSMAHLPYYNLRNQTIQFLEDEDIDFKDVGVGSPMTNQFRYTSVNDDIRRFSNINPDSNQWLIYSNISNLEDPMIIKVKKEYKLVKRFSKYGVFMEVRQKIE